MNKLIYIVVLLSILTGCGQKIVKEEACIAKPPLPPIELNRLVFPDISNDLSLNVEKELVCLPIDDFLQGIENNKKISVYINRCNLIKDTYETYYGVEPNNQIK